MAHRFYTDLAAWWPLISAPAEYAEEAMEVLRHLRSAARPVRQVLELGSGGGNNAYHLKAELELTLVDLNAEMVVVSQRLNPECAHVVGDMRVVRLGQTFDAVFVHDAIDYMVTTDDLVAAMRTAFEHCRPGGVAVFVPDATAETWAPGTEHGGHDALDGRGARYLQWDWDPDPHDESVMTAYGFILRDADGRTEVVHETHETGLFPETTWLSLLAEVGFDATAERERTDDDRTPRTIFVAHRCHAGRVSWTSAGVPLPDPEVLRVAEILDPVLAPLGFPPGQPGMADGHAQVLYCRDVTDHGDGACLDLMIDLAAAPVWRIVDVRYDGFPSERMHLAVPSDPELDGQLESLARSLPRELS